MTASVLLLQQDAAPSDASSLLREAGYHLTRHPDGKALLAALAAGTPDLVLLDTSSQGDCLTLLRSIQGYCPHCPVVVLVDASQSTLASALIQAGAVDYLLKPFNTDQLVSTVRHACSLADPIPDMIVASRASQQVLLLAQKRPAPTPPF